MRLLIPVACILGCTLAAQSAAQEKEVPPLLQKAVRAASSLQYTGVRTVEFRTGPDRVVHDEYIIRDRLRSRVEFPEGSPFHGQIIVENDRERRHYFPEPLNEIRILPPRHVVTISRLDTMIQSAQRRGFTFQVGGSERIVGLSTRQVQFVDPQGNVQQRLWIDQNSGLIVRREMLDRGGSRMGFFEFKRVNFRPNIREEDFQINRRGAKVVTPAQEARSLADQHGLTLRLLPRSSGFALEAVRVLRMGEQVALSQIYSGPQGRLSLFQTRATVDPERMRRMARGDYKVHTWQRGEESFALVGELDVSALRELARRLGDQ
jgi:negative regulator of sigma E activity